MSREIEVYETKGGGNTVVNREDDRNSQAVEKIDAGFQSSFSKFKKRQLKPHNADFSDNVSRPLQYGFKTELNEYEWEGGTRPTNETMMQRYHRLKLEVSELINEVDQLENSKAELLDATPTDVISDLQHLQSSLNQLEIDRIVAESSSFTGSGSVPHSVLFKKLQEQLSAAKAQEKTEDSSGSSSDGLVYEVYGNVEAAKFGHLSKLSELEKRLATLEGVVGKNDGKVSVVAAGLDSDYKDLSSAVLGLQSKIALLDGSHVVSITEQLNELLRSIHKLSDSNKGVGGATKDKEDEEHRGKVTEALETISSISPLVSVVPDVVNRLHTLKELHEHASQLVNTIAGLSGEQDRLSEQVAMLKALLEQVQSSVADSILTLQGNFESLESRIGSLKPQ